MDAREELMFAGLMAILKETEPHLVALGYGGEVHNGGYCGACKEHGMGTCVPHGPTCVGVDLLGRVRSVCGIK